MLTEGVSQKSPRVLRMSTPVAPGIRFAAFADGLGYTQGDFTASVRTARKVVAFTDGLRYTQGDFTVC